MNPLIALNFSQINKILSQELLLINYMDKIMSLKVIVKQWGKERILK